MGFASAYLNERTLFPSLIKEAPEKGTGIIAVVPAFNEPGVITLLDSLSRCTEPPCKAEVLIIVNAPENADAEKLSVNRETISKIKEWSGKNRRCYLRVYAIDSMSSEIRNRGVGLARKTGMDEAVRRFDHLDTPEGIILSIDADCTVSENYFTEVYKELADMRNKSACSIYFEHPLTGDEFPEHVYHSITLYELHLRYYFRGLLFTGFPYVHHTVGSAIAVKALSYVKSGGMNRRMAGEDFYFIQKLALSGGYFNLNTATVYPSPRPSARAPFGTGAAISKMEETGGTELLTYNLNAFRELKSMFSLSEELFNSGAGDPLNIYQDLPRGVKSFVDKNEWNNKIIEIEKNTNSARSSIKRFYDWFNMFMVVKYMNNVHLSMFRKMPVTFCARELLKIMGIDSDTDSDDPVSLLKRFRELEKCG